MRTVRLRHFLARRNTVVLVVLLAVAAVATANGQAAPPISFELVTEPSFPLGGAQRWAEVFSRIGQSSVRIRQGEPGNREGIENVGTEASPSYRVTGVLTARNRLQLPGGEFGLGDRTRIEAWILRLQQDGESGPAQDTAAFGLTAEQLVAFHEKLSAPINLATRGRRAGDVVRDIVRATSLEFTVTDKARQAFQEGELLADDLGKLTGGTALAAALRPLGLVFRPEKIRSGAAARLAIRDVREADEAWPIGWPPQDIPVNVAPKLFESLKVTITNRPLTEALDAIQPRVEVPFLLDHNSLVRGRIDLASAKVSYTKDRSTYLRILENLFFQAGLSCELRVDEAGHPFLWITTR